MIIKDLHPKYQKLAIANQIAQGNKQDIHKQLHADQEMGNFDWDTTPEGYRFWECVDSREYPKIPYPVKQLKSYIKSL